MKTLSTLKHVAPAAILAVLAPMLLFWVLLLLPIPTSFTQLFHTYYAGIFACVFVLFYLAFRMADRFRTSAALGLTLLLFALTLSYMWRSGFTDNFTIGGLVPYKDAKNYYFGANLTLNGFPLANAGQATERPLFPGFLSSILLFTGQNLKLALGVLAEIAGVAMALASRPVRRWLGALPAALFSSLMYFYIQPQLGYAMSELPAFLLGTLAFAMIWDAVAPLNRRWLLIGIAALLTAVSTRAGAFLIFPMLILWAGWALRRNSRFAWSAAAGMGATVVLAYLAINTIYPRLMGVPPGSSFGNFAYAIYGQVNGGTGWHSAIENLDTRSPGVAYRAALAIFLKHPQGLLLGSLKAYRDLLLPTGAGIFPFGLTGDARLLDWVLWATTILLTGLGALHLLRQRDSRRASMLLAALIGILLSIPFLPPIDGGGRFHAATVEFLFVVPGVGIAALPRQNKPLLPWDETPGSGLLAASAIALTVLSLALILPLGIYRFNAPPAYTAPVCAANQNAFAFRPMPGSYIDIVPPGLGSCGSLPRVCLADFARNGVNKTTDDFYQELVSLSRSSASPVRLFTTLNLADMKAEDFILLGADNQAWRGGAILTGCATHLDTKDRTVYRVESVNAQGQ